MNLVAIVLVRKQAVATCQKPATVLKPFVWSPAVTLSSEFMQLGKLRAPYRITIVLH